MKRFLIVIPLAILIFSVTTGEAAVDALTEVVPAGSPVVFYVEDVPSSLAQWEGSPSAGLWNDPQTQAFFAPLREELEIDRWNELVLEETGHSLDEIKAMFTGDFIVFMNDFEVVLTENEEDFDFSIAVLAAVGDNAAAVEELILSQKEKIAEEAEEEVDETDVEIIYETREYRGVDLHVETTTENDEVTHENGWAVVDGVWTFGYPVASLEKVVGDILDGGVEDSLDSGDSFGTVRSHLRDTSSWFFADIEPWVPVVRNLVEMGVGAAQESSPFPLDPNTIMDSLGVEAMQAVFLTFDQNKNTALFDFGLTYSENKGLIKLLAYGPGEAPRPTFIPADSDTFSTASFDFAAAWSAIVDIVNGVNPALMGMSAMQLQTIAQNAGVELDLKRDLLDNLTGELVTIQNINGITGDTLIDLDVKQDQVFAIGIRQREALENAIETLKAIAGQGSEFFTTREFNDHTILTLDMPQAEGEAPGALISYVVTDSRLLISVGSSETLESCLLAMGDSGESVWKQPRVRKAMKMLPEGSTVIQFQDLAQMGDVIFPLIIALDSMTPDEEDSDFRFCDPDAVPDGDLIGKYFSSSVTGAWKDDRSLIFRSWTLPADGK